MSKNHNVLISSEWSQVKIHCRYSYEPVAGTSSHMRLGNSTAATLSMTILMIAVVASPLLAKTTHFIANSADWKSLSSWDNGIPNSSDLAIVNNNSTVYVDGGCYATQLTLGDTSGNTGTASLHDSIFFYSWLETQYTVLGYYGTGTVYHYGGRHTVSTQMLLGYKSGSEGFYSLRGGEIFANSEIVGVESEGTIEQIGGENRVTTELGLGYAAGVTGLYELKDGVMSCNLLGLGSFGQGIFRQSGGSSTVSTVCNLGVEVGSVGTFEISAGESYVNSFRIGYDGSGSVLVQGGAVDVAGGIRLGERTGSVGSVNLSGGQLSADREEVGYLGTGEFTQTGGTNTISDSLYVGGGSSSSGTYKLSGGTLDVTGNIISGDGSSVLIIDGGSLTVSGGSIDVGDLYLGHDVGSNGTHILSGVDQISTDREYVGYSGTGVFTQTGGVHTIGNDLSIGVNTGSNGTYKLSNGTLDVTGNITSGDGTSTLIIDGGTMTASGGSIDVGNLYLGHDVGSNSTHQLSSGQLSADWEVIGRYGTGDFTQTGGTHTVGSVLALGYEPGSNGTYDLSGTGQLSTNSEYIGENGTGSFTQTGGIHTLSDGLSLGYFSGSNGTYELSGTGQLSAQYEYVGYEGAGTFTQIGGTNTILGGSATGGDPDFGGQRSITIGNLAGSNGTYELRGGSLSAQYESLGYNSTGTFIHTAGTNDCHWLVLGDEYLGNGTYQLSGTGQLSANDVWVGFEKTGLFQQTGGTNTIAEDLVLGWESGDSSGTYELSGTGQLSAANEYVGYGLYGPGATGIFIQTGGTNTVNGELVLGYYSGADGIYDVSNGNVAAEGLYIGYGGSGTLNISGSGATITVGNLLHFGDDSTFTAVPGSTIHMTGSAFENENTDPSDLAGLANLTLIFEGGSEDIDPFEVAGEDMGAILAGFDTNFALGTLQLCGDAGIGQLQLVDLFDNQTDWIGSEALYVEDLILGSGSYLDLNGLNLYYLDFIDYGGTIDLNGGSLTFVPEPVTLVLLFLGGLALLRRRK